MREVSDADLLGRFARDRDPSAFELLVWRHRRLVLAACRRVTGHPHDAEDAAQAAFLVLARRADRVRGNLPGWLYRVAYRCAIRVRKASGLRERAGGVSPAGDFAGGDSLDRGVQHRPADAGRSPEDIELAAVIDDELNRLPDALRTPVVLCYLHGLSNRDAADRLGWPVGTLCGRLARAKDRLRDRLSRRGVTLSVSALSALGTTSVGGSAGELARVAAAFAAGEAVPGRAAVVAHGVMRGFPMKSLVAGLLAAVAVGLSAFATDPPKPAAPAKPDAEAMQGEWAFDTVWHGGYSRFDAVWDARLRFAGDGVTLSGLTPGGYDADVLATASKATFTLDPTADPKRIDIKLAPTARLLLRPNIWVATPGDDTFHGLYALDGDTLTVALPRYPSEDRPKSLNRKLDGSRTVFTARRLPRPGVPTPTGITLAVRNPDGTPAAGAAVHQHLWHTSLPIDNEKPGWNSRDWATAAADGTAVVRRAGDAVFNGLVHARVPGTNRVGVTTVSPYRAATESPVPVPLVEGRKVTGTLACPELDERRADYGWAHVSADHPLGHLAGYQSFDRRFEFTLPPGAYTLRSFGTYLTPCLTSVTVPPGRAELDLGAIRHEPTAAGRTLGKPAPELAAVKGWKGTPTTLAALKGKPVLLFFWLYEKHGPSYTRDLLADLHAVHERYAGRGLEVILVAVDRDGEVSTPEAFATAVKRARGKDDRLAFPFRVALLHNDLAFASRNGLLVGNRTMSDYGVSFPMSSVLIDRAGNVVGEVYPMSGDRDRERLEAVIGK